MSIKSAKYTKLGSIEVEFEDGQIFTVPDDMSNRHRQDVEEWVNTGHSITPWIEPGPTNLDVNVERERRIIAGHTFEITGIGSVTVTGSPEEVRNLQSLQSVATLRMMNQDATSIKFRDANNTDHMLEPMQIIELFTKSAAYISNLYDKSWSIKAMDPIPSNFKDDSYWS